MNPSLPGTRRSVWIAGARPRTLPAAVVPVAVGSAVAFASRPGHWDATSWGAAALALGVALSLQVGVNFANDYSDGVRGTDAERVGPVRLVAGGLAEPRAVRRAAFASFATAAALGLGLSAWRAPWLIAVGAACILAAWYYTGGSHPYGYAGFGELSVFVFFGIVATVGTTYVVAGRFVGMSLVASVAVGLLAVALLVTNNLRDIDGDSASGKVTLVVRLGDARTRTLFTMCCVAPLVIVASMAAAYGRWWVLIAVGAAPFAAGPPARVRRGDSGRSLLPVLALVGRYQIVFGALVAGGIALSR